MVVDPGCMKCMDCVSVCPNDALYFGFGRPSIAVPQSAPKHHSLTWGEEVAGMAVFLVSFWAAWDVYQLVPMLMALGCATITTFLALTTAKLLRARDLSFYRFDLKASGRIRRAGWGFAAFALLWIGLNAHSGWVRHHESAGARAFEGIQVPDELALARANPDPWLSPIDRRNIALGEAASSRRPGWRVVREQRGPPEARVARVPLRQLGGCRPLLAHGRGAPARAGQGPEPLLSRRHPEPPGAPPGSAHQSRPGPGRAVRPGPRSRGEGRIAVAARPQAGGRLGLDGRRREQCRSRPGEQPARRRRRVAGQAGSGDRP